MLLYILQTVTPEAEKIAQRFNTDSLHTKGAEIAEILRNTPPKELIEEMVTSCIKFGIKLVIALLLYLIGAWLIRKSKNFIARAFTRRGADATLTSFMQSLVTVVLWIILIMFMIGTLGINTTSLAALLAAGGMALGMALSGTVQKFAGGMMLMVFKPFKAGDYIEAQGYAGIVTEVTIVGTHLTTIDNRRVVLPNGALSNGNIVNYSSFPLRRIDLPVSVEYGTDAAACKEKLLEIVREDARILDAQTPGAADPFVAVQKLSESSVNFIIRAWVKGSDFWPAQFDLNERIYTELPQAGIKFPFPQLDVHVQSAE